MTDPQNWPAPTGDRQDQPRFGEYGPPSGPPGLPSFVPPVAPPLLPPAGTTPQDWPPPPAWTPPPRPGLVPLRPLGFGTLLWAPFQVLRRNPKATFGSALLVQGGVFLVTLLIVGPVTALSLGRISSAPVSEQATVAAGATLTIVLSALVPILLSVVASALLQGVIVIEVARATLGEKLRLGRLWRLAGRRLWPLALWALTLSAFVIVCVAAVTIVVVVLVLLLGGPGIALGIVVGILATLVLVAAGVWLFTKTSLVPSIIVLERVGIRAAVARSWTLTNGYFWRTLGVQFLVSLIVNIVSQVVATPLSVLFNVALSVVDPNSSFDAYLPALALYVLILFFSLVIGAIAAVIQSATTALIYIDLRMRTEGLDLELQRFVESVPGSGAADPYLPSAGRMPGVPLA